MKIGKDCIGVSVAALILNDKKEILLVKRSQACKFDAGKWTLIVGEVNFGESLADALHREAAEETGLEVEVVRPIELVEILPKETGVHWVGLDYLCCAKGGALQNKEPEIHEELRYFSFDGLPAPLGRSTRETIDKYLSQTKA